MVRRQRQQFVFFQISQVETRTLNINNDTCHQAGGLGSTSDNIFSQRIYFWCHGSVSRFITMTQRIFLLIRFI